MNSTRVAIPTLVRIKPGALGRLGIYLARFKHQKIMVLQSAGLPSAIGELSRREMQSQGIQTVHCAEIDDNRFEQAVAHFTHMPRGATAIVGLGGGKALDVAKYVAFMSRLPYFACPTSLSNDGFCSPQSSLTIEGKRRSLPAAMPFGVVVDTMLCQHAPRLLTLSGIGDLVAKFTAIHDWKLAFHHTGEVVDDFAAILSDGAVHAFLGRPLLVEEGVRLLANSLLLNGIAMEVCGSSRPASGSEHLISHALDEISARPRLHGLQVGVATYLVSLLQKRHAEVIDQLFERTGFWDAIAQDPFCEAEWLAAIRLAPSIKPGFYTVLSSPDVLAEAAALLRENPRLKRCFAMQSESQP